MEGWSSRGNSQKGGLETEFATTITAELNDFLYAGTSEVFDLESVEAALKHKALFVAARFLEDKINQDTSDRTGATRACIFCGQKARYVEQRPKQFTTVLGDITLTTRLYYFCFTCSRGFRPKDYSLGLAESSLSPGVARMVGLVASEGSYMEGTMLLHELAALDVSAKCVERTAKKIGEAIIQDEATVVTETKNSSTTVYLGVDGTGVPMRSDELSGRKGKQQDGSAKTREVKECVVLTADSRDEKGNPVRDPGSVRYIAGIESCAWPHAGISEQVPPFARRVEQEIVRTGYFSAPRQVFIGDGAPWIWNLAAMIAPDAIQIVDLYHAKEHLSELANKLFGRGTDLSRQWALQQHTALESGYLDLVLQAIACHKTRPGELADDVKTEFDYFYTNQHRMRYDYFRSLDLCVGSGVVEAGCRVVVGQRLKRSGMFWSLPDANAILALRCYLLSHRFDDFWYRYMSSFKSRVA